MRAPGIDRYWGIYYLLNLATCTHTHTHTYPHPSFPHLCVLSSEAGEREREREGWGKKARESAKCTFERYCLPRLRLLYINAALTNCPFNASQETILTPFLVYVMIFIFI